MVTRTLRLKIPRPGPDGLCSDLCPMNAVRVSPYTGRMSFYCAAYLLQAGAIRMVPGPSCPWGHARGSQARQGRT